MQQRVLIEDVRPQIEGGRFYIKRIVGEAVEVSADIFSDGHDHVRATVQYKHTDDKSWKEVEMTAYPNDLWKATFTPTEKGFYQYTIHAWVDHLLTWYEGFKKKVVAGNAVQVELKEGVLLLERIVQKLKKTEKQDLQDIIDVLSDENRYQDAIALVMDSEFEVVVERYPLKQHHTVFDKKLKLLVEREKVLFSTWYEFFPRSASETPGKHGTFTDCHRLLPKLKEMGFDVLYFPPIHPIGKLNRKGRNNAVNAEAGDVGSPWAIGSDEGGHKAIEPALGTMEDFEQLLQNAADMGIEIAMDIAFQCAPDHPYITEHPAWFKWRPDGTIAYAENPPKKYQDIVPLDFETEDWENLWNELKSIFEFWIEKGVTIFRVDNPHTKSFNFWEWCINEIKAKNPDVIFLAEAFSRPRIMQGLAKRGFTQSYTYFTWRNSKQELTEYLLELTRTEMREYYRPNFWPNTPDILPYELQSGKENLFILRYALAATLSSSYGMYGPVYEQYVHEPVIGKEEYYFSEKYELKRYDWYKKTRLSEIIARVNQVRKANPALQTTYNITFCNTSNDKVIAYFKYTPDLSNIIFVAVNMNPDKAEAAWIQVPKQVLRLTDNLHLTLDDQLVFERYTWLKEWNFVALDPWKMPFHLCVVRNNNGFRPIEKPVVTRGHH